MSDEVVRIDLTGRIDGKIVTGIRAIAKAALEADTNVDLLRQALQGFSAGSAIRAASNDTRTLRTEIVKATQSQRLMTKEVSAGAAAFLKGAAASDKYGNSLRRAGTATTQLGAQTSSLRGLVGTVAGLFGGIFAIAGYARAQDALTGIQNQLRSLTPDVERQVELQRQLFDVANRTRSGIEATAGGFVRFSKAMRDASDGEVLRFVETLNKSLISAGRTTDEVSSIVTQLGQALTSGKLMGDEFKSLSENLPYEALEAIARQLGVGVDQLKALSSEGVITTEVLRKAFAELAESVDATFARSVPTIGQALEMLNNDFIEFTASTSGSAGIIAQAIMTIGDNLYLIIPAIAAVAAAWLTISAVKIIIEIVGAIGVLISWMGRAAIATYLFLGPWGLLAVAIIGTVAAIAYFTGSLDGMINAMGEVANKIMEKLGLTKQMTDADTQAAKASQQFASLTEGHSDAMAGLTDATNDNAKATQDWSKKVIASNQAVASSYNDLAAAAKAALMAGSAKEYATLQSKGGSSGSFQAIGKPSNNNVTTLAKPKGYYNGGSMIVGGRPGVDKNYVGFNASQGERIDVKTAAQQRAEKRGNGGTTYNGGTNVQMTVVTKDANSFRRSRGQIAADFAASLRV